MKISPSLAFKFVVAFMIAIIALFAYGSIKNSKKISKINKFATNNPEPKIKTVNLKVD